MRCLGHPYDGCKNRSSYALMLIKMEERRNDMSALYSHFGKNAISERIEAIMKFKKTSILACAWHLLDCWCNNGICCHKD